MANKAAIREAISVLEQTPIERLVPPSYRAWEDEKGRVCPMGILENHFEAGEWSPLRGYLGVSQEVVLEIPTIYDKSTSRWKGKAAVIFELRTWVGDEDTL